MIEQIENRIRERVDEIKNRTLSQQCTCDFWDGGDSHKRDCKLRVLLEEGAYQEYHAPNQFKVKREKMRSIPKSLLEEILSDEWYEKCVYPDCMRKAELEHVWTRAGKQLNEKWAIIPVCPYHHRIKNNGKPVDKDYHKWISLNLATDKNLFDKFRKRYQEMLQMRKHLNEKYGGRYSK